ncbi:MAG: enoyl-CoA hydratase-related protein, partial [Gammaproteobacteria bacterium]|nr:enoyl-CoA hydratase-related protein [Gammaproteobacteria bacterium]
MMQHWKLDTDKAGIAWLCLDKADAKANVLSSEVLLEFNDVLEELAGAPPRGLVLYSGKPGSFVMGADISEFTSIKTAEKAFELTRLGQQLFDKLENLPCPTVAVINGICLGGGLEMVMACDYRVGPKGDSRILGLPEVKLGLHPGFGGTVRAVNYCGVRAGMQLMLTGNPVDSRKGLRIGLLDRIAGDDDWRAVAEELIAKRPPQRKAPLVDRLMSLRPLRPMVRKMLIRQVASKARKDHYPAPYA